MYLPTSVKAIGKSKMALLGTVSFFLLDHLING